MNRCCRDGSDPNAKAVATGSHTDAIPFAGKYDGVVGVVGGIEAIRTLKRSVTNFEGHFACWAWSRNR